jgi:hypothetical protein
VDVEALWPTQKAATEVTAAKPAGRGGPEGSPTFFSGRRLHQECHAANEDATGSVHDTEPGAALTVAGAEQATNVKRRGCGYRRAVVTLTSGRCASRPGKAPEFSHCWRQWGDGRDRRTGAHTAGEREGQLPLLPADASTEQHGAAFADVQRSAAAACRLAELPPGKVWRVFDAGNIAAALGEAEQQPLNRIRCT